MSRALRFIALCLCAALALVCPACAAAPASSSLPPRAPGINAAVPVAAKYTPMCVFIVVTGPTIGASASGTIVDGRGYVLTNWHVIFQAETIRVTTFDQQTYEAAVVMSDTSRDLALLKLDTDRSDFPAAVMGTMADAPVGADVLALGFPGGLTGPVSVTEGIVSAIRELDGHTYIQTDAVINPGSSGGCLVTYFGKMVGVPVASIKTSQDLELVGLVIPVDDVRAFLEASLARVP